MSKPFDEFPLSISAYITDTQHLSTLQHGAYLLILMTMRRAGGWIPDDDRKLANIVKLSLAKWRQIAPDVRSLLVADGGKLSQKRVLSDLEKMRLLSLKNAMNGKSGGEAKSLKSKQPDLATATFSLGGSPAERQNGVVNAIPFLLESESKTLDSESKKVSNSRGKSLSSEWVATEVDFAYGERLGLSRADVDSCAEEMRLWAKANANRAVGRKADWSATFHGWLRREAPKLKRQNGGTTNEANRNVYSKAGFSGLAARVRYGGAGSDPAPRPTPGREPSDRR
jgi:uncharacterized protein YdaU (DUF1376 family)